MLRRHDVLLAPAIPWFAEPHRLFGFGESARISVKRRPRRTGLKRVCAR